MNVGTGLIHSFALAGLQIQMCDSFEAGKLAIILSFIKYLSTLFSILFPFSIFIS
jgi:hypothetical protein